MHGHTCLLEIINLGNCDAGGPRSTVFSRAGPIMLTQFFLIDFSSFT